ncbi:MAG: membrane protein insertase YidC [bacterium]
MEKRALLAFLLSVAILTIWSYWFVPQPQPPVPEERPGQLQGTEEQPRVFTPQKAPMPEPLLPQAQMGHEALQDKTVRVETPFYVALIGARGAALESWQLKRYRESLPPDAPPIELIRGEKGERGLELAFEQLDGARINNSIFRFDQDLVTINQPNEKAVLKATLPLSEGGVLLKEFTFYGDRYSVDMNVSVCDSQGRPLASKMGLVITHLASRISSSSTSFSGPVALSSHGLEELGDLEKVMGKPMDVRWGGFAQQYFIFAAVPQAPGRHDLVLEKKDDKVRLSLWQGASTQDGCQHPFRIYLGPKSIEDLKLAGEDLDKALHLGFFDVIARPLLLAMKFINDYTHNYGIAIIVLTIVIKLLFWPLTHKSYASMKEMQRIQPRIKQIRERFKNDREQMNREMMLLYKTHKVNPLGGCLPMVLQIPVFFALYKALLDSIELRHAPFIFWVKDLSAPDYLLRFPSGFSFFGIEGIGPLPLLMGASMVIQQKMTPTMGDPTQAKVMMLMPIFFTFLFISFPSGLVLYWLINNVLSIVQQIYINSRVE